MKNSLKIAILGIAAGSVLSFSSCTGSTPSVPKTNIKNSVDSLSYAIGVAQTQGIEMYLQQQGIEKEQYSELVKGILEGANINSKDPKTNAYEFGRNMGTMVTNQILVGANQHFFGEDSTKQINKSQFLAAFTSSLLGKDLAISQEEAPKMVEAMEAQLKAEQFKEVKAANAAFLQENKGKEGVVTLPSGMQYKVITEGTGEKPSATDKVKVHYVGTLIDGTEFDSSVGRGTPFEFSLTGGVIQGWIEAVQLMPVGSKYIFYIPYDLAYGANGNGRISPFATLIFEIELLEIVK